jgi:hypothetical protein
MLVKGIIFLVAGCSVKTQFRQDLLNYQTPKILAFRDQL